MEWNNVENSLPDCSNLKDPRDALRLIVFGKLKEQSQKYVTVDYYNKEHGFHTIGMDGFLTLYVSHWMYWPKSPK